MSGNYYLPWKSERPAEWVLVGHCSTLEMKKCLEMQKIGQMKKVVGCSHLNQAWVVEGRVSMGAEVLPVEAEV